MDQKVPGGGFSAPVLSVPSSASPAVASPVVYTPPSARAHTPSTGLNRSKHDGTGRHGHGRNKSMTDWFKSPGKKDVGKDEVFSPASVSKAVEEERHSRNLFTGGALGSKQAAPRDGTMFEFFALCSFASAVTADMPTAQSAVPSLLWAWPDSEGAAHIHYFPQFCLPSASVMRPDRDHEFVFAVSSELNAAERLLCCCIMVPRRDDQSAKPRFLQVPEQAPAARGHRRSLSTGTYGRDGLVEMKGTPRCYVLVTRYPYVRIMLHVLRAVVAFDRQPSGDVLSLLARVRVQVPEEDEVMRIDERLTWKRKADSPLAEEHYLSDWALPCALDAVCRNDAKAGFLTRLLSLTMLERPVVLHSDSLQALTSVAFALTTLTRPFVYQAVFLPLLPPSLLELLQAPVPFLVGVHSASLPLVMEQLRENPSQEVLLANLDTQTIFDVAGKKASFPETPFVGTLKKQLHPLVAQILAAAKVGAEDRELEMVQQLRAACSSFWDKLFADFRKHCFRDMTKPEEPVTIFMQEAFIEEMESKKDGARCKEWFEAFFKTQIWLSHSDQKRTELDLRRRNSVLSARMVSDFHRVGGYSPVKRK